MELRSRLRILWEEMAMITLTKLLARGEKLASEATPGPWHADKNLDPSAVYCSQDMPVAVAETFGGNAVEYAANAAFIAHFHPQRILAMIAVAKAARTLDYAIGGSEDEILSAVKILRQALAALEELGA